ncbi:Riboflavin synthase eubacterial/eukaryotic [hydrothermal vent metagenome]|uniref:Riboflavin synthase n=1 Tax=hydrothermal vent metagenome TaxID=652676 RepID=A0A3B1AMT0_9ZZZZ
MFTGIIQSIGSIKAIKPQGNDIRLQVATNKLDLSDVQLGDSIAVNGVCLTAVELSTDSFTADVSNETLSCTTFADLVIGLAVNLEKALTPMTRLGGHLVSGHVDGIATIIERVSDGRSERFVIEAPSELAKYIAVKGSICVNGISLTVNSVDGASFSLNIVPHTLQETDMAGYQKGSRVNLEVDVIARYLERLMLGDKAADKDSKINEAFLAASGFIK